MVADDGAVPRRSRRGHRPLCRPPPAQPVHLGHHREASRLRVLRHARARRPPAPAQAAGRRSSTSTRSAPTSRVARRASRPTSRRSTTTSGWSGSGSRASTSTRADRTTATSTPRRPGHGWASCSRPTCVSTIRVLTWEWAGGPQPGPDHDAVVMLHEQAVRDPDGSASALPRGRIGARSRRRQPGGVRQPGVHGRPGPSGAGRRPRSSRRWPPPPTPSAMASGRRSCCSTPGWRWPWPGATTVAASTPRTSTRPPASRWSRRCAPSTRHAATTS